MEMFGFTMGKMERKTRMSARRPRPAAFPSRFLDPATLPDDPTERGLMLTSLAA